MDARLNIRLTQEEREILEQKASELGYKNHSDFARVILKRGIESITLGATDYHLLANTTQSLMLLREVISMLGNNNTVTNDVITSVKDKTKDWISQYENGLSQTSGDENI